MKWKPINELATEGNFLGDDPNDNSYMLEPGMVLLLDDGDMMLVGDCNSMGGGCNCCTQVELNVGKTNITHWARIEFNFPTEKERSQP